MRPLLDRHPARPAAAGLPAVQALAVEEQDPARLLLLGREPVVGAVGATAGVAPASPTTITSKPDRPIVRILMATSVFECRLSSGSRRGDRGRTHGDSLSPSHPLHNRAGRPGREGAAAVAGPGYHGACAVDDPTGESRSGSGSHGEGNGPTRRDHGGDPWAGPCAGRGPGAGRTHGGRLRPVGRGDRAPAAALGPSARLRRPWT